jgi:hypothetical protein
LSNSTSRAASGLLAAALLLGTCPTALAGERDSDRDGIPNVHDRDVDGDGRPNTIDQDIDGDGLRNSRDSDVDGDGIANYADDDSDSSGDAATEPLRPVPPRFFGMTSEDSFALDQPARDAELRRMRHTGAGTLRKTFHWSEIERSPGVYNFRYYDHVVAATAFAGLTLLPVLLTPPPFHSTAPPGAPANWTYPPVNYEAFADLAQALVSRYGQYGYFWDARPDIPRKPIRAWQVWNEPNALQFWPTGPSPEWYVVMSRPVAAAIRRADPDAVVVSAGLGRGRFAMPAFLTRMYRAGAADLFDAVGVHAYAPAPDHVTSIIARARRVMSRAGDHAARIWVTETGAGTAGPVRQPLNVGPRAQAGLIRSTFKRVVRMRRRLGVQGIVYYSWRDLPPHGGQPDFWGLYAGLHQLSGAPKPAFSAFANTVQALTEP